MTSQDSLDLPGGQEVAGSNPVAPTNSPHSVGNTVNFALLGIRDATRGAASTAFFTFRETSLHRSAPKSVRGAAGRGLDPAEIWPASCRDQQDFLDWTEDQGRSLSAYIIHGESVMAQRDFTTTIHSIGHP
jgi:hypothetical protein